MTIKTLSSVPNVVVFWQKPAEGIGDEAIALKKYSDVLEITQGESTINVTLECVEDFVKALRSASKDKTK